MSRRTSRRALFGSTALLATLPAFARPHGPDHELIALCGAFVVACDQFEADWGSIVDDVEQEREGRRMLDLMARQVTRMGELRAVTTEGIQARALALHRDMPSGAASSLADPSTTAARLFSYLMRDAAALAGAA